MDNDKRKEHLLEIYKIYLKTAEDTTDRRLRSNNFYFSICSLILTSIGGIVIYVWANNNACTSTEYGFKYAQVTYTLTKTFTCILKELKPLFLITSFMGFCCSILWLFNVHSYKRLNDAKFAVIEKIEKEQLFYGFCHFKCFKEEDEKLKTYKVYQTVIKKREYFTAELFIGFFLYLLLSLLFPSPPLSHLILKHVYWLLPILIILIIIIIGYVLRKCDKKHKNKDFSRDML